MDENDEKAKREGGIDFGDVAGGRDANINLEHVAGRDIVTSYHYYGMGAEQKDEDVARPLRLPDGLPEVGDLPEGSRVLHRYNRFFVGREEELKELARLLQAGQTAAIGEVAGITGLGGVGKSQLAVAVVYRYGRFFPGGGVLGEYGQPGGD